MQLNPARLNNESFENYQARRKRENDLVASYLARGHDVCKHQIVKSINPETKLTQYFLKPRQYRPYQNIRKQHARSR